MLCYHVSLKDRWIKNNDSVKLEAIEKENNEEDDILTDHI